MIKYLEYVYLLAALGLCVVLALNFKQLPPSALALCLVMISLFSFLFAFRRQQKKQAQQPPNKD